MRLIAIQCLLVLILSVASLTAFAEGEVPEIKRANPPEWVDDVPVNLTAIKKSSEVDGGTYRVLTERQINVAEGVRYGHFANQFLTEGAVQDGSRISLTFEPSYETLTFHRLVVHRGGKSMDRLPKQAFKVLQRETRLDRHLYDGRLSAEVILEDIRVGDILEYAYSVRGRNPIFAGRHMDAFYTNYDEPVEHFRFRLLTPADRPLKFKNFGRDLKPAITTRGGVTEYLWEARDIPALISDREVPSWFEPWDWVQVTEFDSWAAVAQWENEIYQVPTDIPDELQNEVSRIRTLEIEQDRVQAALRYVQDNIRYLGMEVGVNTHKPYPIETILARRFGDCKDKALMLCAMLRHLGFEAYPALVSTGERQVIADWLPSPRAFDHLVVQLHYHGTEIWLDPTNRDQGGSLEKMSFPAYGQSLVIAPQTTSLTKVRAGGFAESAKEIVETYNFKDFGGNATLGVTIVSRGDEADDARSYQTDTSLEAIRKTNLNFYAQLFPQVEAVAAPVFKDDRAGNILTESESYKISGLWKKVDGEKEDIVGTTFTSQYLRDLDLWPDTSVRTMPYALTYPHKLVHVIEINFPRVMKFDAEHVIVDDPAFRFEYSVVSSGQKLTLRHSFESRMDHVPAAAVPKYLENVKRLRRVLSYQVTVPAMWAKSSFLGKIANPATTAEMGPASTSENSRAAQAVGVMLLFLAVTAGFVIWRVTRRPGEEEEATPLHRCVVCGETERSNASLEFRVATNGDDYCTRHLPPPLPPGTEWEGGRSKA